MKIVLVGSPLSGKTTILKKLKEMNINVFNADSYVHNHLYKINQPGYLLIKERFGPEYVNTNEVDRKKLSLLMIQSKENLKLLNELIHPLVMNYFNSIKGNVVAEIPLVVFSKLNFQYDKVVLVKCSKEELIKRFNSTNRKINTDFIEEMISKWNNSINYDFVIDTTNGVSEDSLKEFVNKYKLNEK